ncbi:copper-sensing transcriptional repressor CsoR [soil metagenome]
MQPEKKRDALTRLKTVRGHLDGVIRMLGEDAYCVDLMKQISALQSSLERVNRVVLASHLETCFQDAVSAGEGSAAVSELVDAIKFNPALTGPGARVTEDFLGEAAVPNPGEGSTS